MNEPRLDLHLLRHKAVFFMYIPFVESLIFVIAYLISLEPLGATS